MGPLVSAAQRDKARDYARLAVEEGGTLLVGGEDDARLSSLDDDGYWWPPTVVDGVPHSSRTASEEVFGPNVSLHYFDTEDEAVRLANESTYGLAASVWTEDVTKAHDVSSRIDAGTVWVNCWLHRELHMPFGGMKASGVAREGGVHSLDFYSETSTVCVKLGNRTPPPLPGAAFRKAQQTTTRPLHTSARRRAPDGDAPRGFVESAPKPMGAYPHAKRVGDLVFLAGIGPRDPETDGVMGEDGVMGGVPGGPIDGPDGARRDYDVEAQTRQCVENVKKVLRESGGLTLEDCVDVHAFLVDMKRDFQAFNAVYAEHFAGLESPPTRTTVEIGELPPGGRIAVELKVIAKARD